MQNKLTISKPHDNWEKFSKLPVTLIIPFIDFASFRANINNNKNRYLFIISE